MVGQAMAMATAPCRTRPCVWQRSSLPLYHLQLHDLQGGSVVIIIIVYNIMSGGRLRYQVLALAIAIQQKQNCLYCCAQVMRGDTPLPPLLLKLHLELSAPGVRLWLHPNAGYDSPRDSWLGEHDNGPNHGNFWRRSFRCCHFLSLDCSSLKAVTQQFPISNSIGCCPGGDLPR